MLKNTDKAITLGQGGQILDVPENQVLLEAVKATPPLTPAGLLKIATFFQEYKTNAPLASHLALAALSTQVTNPQVQKALSTANIPSEINLSPNDIWDWAEDLLDGGNDENTEGSSSVIIKSVPFSGMGLLVETTASGSFVIGVSPTV